MKKKNETVEAAGRGRKADDLLLRDMGFRGTPYTNSLNYDSDIYLPKAVTVVQKQGEWSTSNLTMREVPGGHEAQAWQAARSEPPRPFLPGRNGYHRVWSLNSTSN
jgi:hypothetical protein